MLLILYIKQKNFLQSAEKPRYELSDKVLAVLVSSGFRVITTGDREFFPFTSPVSKKLCISHLFSARTTPYAGTYLQFDFTLISDG